MLTRDQNAASVDTRSVSNKIGSPLARNAGPNPCRLTAIINDDGYFIRKSLVSLQTRQSPLVLRMIVISDVQGNSE